MEGLRSQGRGQVLIIRHGEVGEVLAGRELELIDLVRDLYLLHDRGGSVLPHSVFLRFPGNSSDRAIALPAYLGGGDAAFGLKWISSFPGNLERGMDRASSVIILNSLATGHPEALIEASLISAKRTAASAALAAGLLAGDPAGITLIGCGVINFEVLRFVAARLPSVLRATVVDRLPERATAFARRVARTLPGVAARVGADRAAALAEHGLVSIATTAASPHMDLTDCPAGTTVLHISLRDLTAETILASQNVVDDADHVCREQTSLHLAEQITGGRAFIGASIGALLSGNVTLQRDPAANVIFSPFGLGILDLAVARLVCAEAVRRDDGIRVTDFIPARADVGA